MTARTLPLAALFVGATLAAAQPAASQPATTTPAAAQPAPAQPATRVLLIIDQGDDPFAERIRAELAAMGLGVLTLEPWRTGEAVPSLEAVARREQVVAAVRMIPSRKGVEIWLAEQSTGRPLLRQLVVDESPEGPNQGLVALQTVELLRTTLRSAPPFGVSPGAGPEPAPGGVGAPAEPPGVVASAPASPRPALGVDVAVGALFSPGGAGSAVQAWLTLQRPFGQRLALALDASLPVRAATMTGAEGSARVGTYLAGLALLVRAAGPSRGVHMTAAVGASVVRVAFDGSAVPPLVSRSQSALTGAGYLRVDIGVDVTDWLRLGVRGVSGLAIERVQVRFAGNDAGGWGRSFFAGFVVAELTWR